MRPSIRLMVGTMCALLLVSLAVLPRAYAESSPAVSALEYETRLSGSVQAVGVGNGYAYAAGIKDLDSVFTVFSLSNPLQPVPLGTLDLLGAVKMIKVRGTTAFVASNKGLYVINVADPDQPALIATVTAAGLDIHDLQLINTTLYAASGNGLVIFDISNPAAITARGGYSIDAISVWVEGTRAYLGTGNGGLRILDISNPDLPVYLGTFGLSGTPNDIVVSGSMMYVAAGFGLLKVDVSNPAEPVELARFNESVNITAFGTSLELVGTRLYLTDRYWGLLIFDVMPGAAMPLVGTYRSSGEGLGLAVSGPLVYIADGAVGMKIIDTSAMRQAAVIGGMTTTRSVDDSQRVGNLLYTLQSYFISPTAERGSLVIVDVSNPQAPTLVKDLPFAKPARSFKVVGTKAYIASSAEGLKIVDVANPAAAAVVGTIAPPSSLAGVFSDIDVANGLAVLSGAGLFVYDVANPTQPQLRGSIAQGGSAVKVVGGMAYVAAGNGDMRIIDISNPAAPALLSNLTVGMNSYDIDVAGSIAYVSMGGDGLALVDVSNAAAPREINTFNVIGEAYGVKVENQRVYVTGAYHGLTVIDLRTPQKPYLLAMLKELGHTSEFDVHNGIVSIMGMAFPGTMLFLDTNVIQAPALRGAYATMGLAWDVAFASATIAYVAAGPGGLQIIDTAVPDQPRLVGSYDARSSAPYGGARDTIHVEVVGNRAYVLDALNGFDVLDISNPLNPVRLGRTDWFYANAMVVRGTLAYGMDWVQGTRVINVANPAAPTTQYFPSTVFGLDGAGSLIYTGNYQGFRIYNMANPASPQLVGSYVDQSNDCNMTSVVLVGQIAYVGTNHCGLTLIDISNPAAPTKVGSFPATTMMNDLTLVGNTLYVSHWGTGILVLDVANPTAPRELARLGGVTSNVLRIEPRADYLYVAQGFGGLYVYHYSRPTLAEVGPAGGTLTSSLDTTAYQFAAGTFAESTVIKHTPIFSRPPSGELYNIGHTFDITGTVKTTGLGVQPNAPFTVTIQYRDNQKGGVLENTLGLYFWDGSQWVAEPSSMLNAATNTVVAAPNRFGLFAVLGETNHVYLPIFRR